MNRVASAAAAAIFLSGSAIAQTATTQPGTASVGAPASHNQAGAEHDSGKAAASGDTNQAVVTTDTNADTPAKGANSFTLEQAKNRIGAKGYTDVGALKKDANGVWRGQGTKDGQPVQVWLDYKGNVGQQS